ncbi:MAG TPA: hypothetical protein P5328_00320 [Candidatus Paceibacterota bacterium]|nr:hypothetical protein [Candidatus Paceibacterota bacterium]HRZ34228.1 hypothetical protein [Candidatus Paceibacterota bacterium]
MESISFYLKKFENLGLKENNIKRVVVECVKDATGIELSPKEIDVTNRQVRINKVGVEKTEIFINKSKIENLVRDRLQIDRRIS